MAVLLADRWRLSVSRRLRRRDERIDTVAGPRPATFYLPLADRPDPAPGLLILPTAAGRSAHEDAIALRFAEAGYVALVVSFSSRTTGSVLQDPARRAVLEQTVRAARDRLAAEPAVDAARLAAVGYSLGGHFALHLAIAGAVSAAVVYFGVYSWPDEAIGRLAAPVLIHQGEHDSSEFTTNARAFVSEARRRRKRCELITYPGAVHQFDLFQPGSFATVDAWRRTLAFLDSSLPPPDKPLRPRGGDA